LFTELVQRAANVFVRQLARLVTGDAHAGHRYLAWRAQGDGQFKSAGRDYGRRGLTHAARGVLGRGSR
jgi:hypothetical protein